MRKAHQNHATTILTGSEGNSGQRTVLAQRVWEDSGREDMEGYLAVRNHTNGVDLQQLGKSAWDQQLGKIDCVFCIMRCLSTLEFPKYIPPVAQFISIIPVSPYTPPKSLRPSLLHLYRHTAPANFPLANLMAEVVRNRLSRHNRLQVHY